MAKRLRIAVVMGGPSPEHDVSLKSGEAILSEIDPEKYILYGVTISRDGGEWRFERLPRQKHTGKPKTLKLSRALDYAGRHLDVAVLALHGAFGEDGIIQALLGSVGVSYTGSDMAASAIAMDKLKSNALFSRAGLKVPETVALSAEVDEETAQTVIEPIGYPVIIKPVRAGSSVGTSPVHNADELSAALEAARPHGEMMAQELIAGEEATCGVYDDGAEVHALPPIHIVPKEGWFDYKNKYTPGATDERVPSDLPDKTNARLQELSLKAHQALGCSGLTRTDFIITDDNEFYILETNTIPGMTANSLVPRSIRAEGKTVGEVIDGLIVAALRAKKS